MGFFSWPNYLMDPNGNQGCDTEPELLPTKASQKSTASCKLKVTALALSISPCGLSSRFHLTAALAHPRVALAKVLLQGSHMVELCVRNLSWSITICLPPNHRLEMQSQINHSNLRIRLHKHLKLCRTGFCSHDSTQPSLRTSEAQVTQ